MVALAEYNVADLAALCAGNEAPSSCFLGKVFYLSRRRNAFWGRESLGRFSDYSLDMDDALLGWKVERGSQWSVTELPAIVVASTHAAFYLVPKHWIPNALSSLLRMRRLQPEMVALCSQLHDRACREALAFISTRDRAQPALLPYSIYRPTLEANAHVWWPRSHECEIRTTLRIILKFNALLQTCAHLGHPPRAITVTVG